MTPQDKWPRDGNTIRRILITASVVTVLILAAISVNISMPRASYDPNDSIQWENASHDPHPQLTYTDGDGIPDVEEYYCGHPIYVQDMDADGMLDFWEAQWSVVDPVSEERSLYGLDATDMLEDPDGDGYDFNGNGRIDWYDDRIVSCYSDIPSVPTYSRASVENLVASPELYHGSLVLLEEVYVEDNGSYREGDGSDHASEISIEVVDHYKSNYRSTLTVILRPYSIRPSDLEGRYEFSEGRYLRGTWVDIQGRFVQNDSDMYIEVRGGEQFTNLHEFNSRFYTGDPTMHPVVRERDHLYNETDPMNPDTDGDGMTDGWEARYGRGYWDAANGTRIWVWQIDPTDPRDATRDPDEDGWNNLEEFNLGTSPIDGTSYP